MRFNPQEITGSRVRLRYGVELHYNVAGPAEFLGDERASHPETHAPQVVLNVRRRARNLKMFESLLAPFFCLLMIA